jgi:hypothetical protein
MPHENSANKGNHVFYLINTTDAPDVSTIMAQICQITGGRENKGLAYA